MKKWLICIFFLGCHNIQLHSEQADWCFIDFHSREAFYNYIESHKNYAQKQGHISSMKLLGCAYYQKGQLDLAEKWLSQAYTAGDEGVASALTAMYLKEGRLDLALNWKNKISLVTGRERWLYVLDSLERYKKTQDVYYLHLAHTALEKKIQFEGDTEMTTQLSANIESLIQYESNCNQNSQCSLVAFNEKKSYLNIFSKGALATLVPVIPKAWSYDPQSTGILPPEESKPNNEAVTNSVKQPSAAAAAAL